MRTAYGLANIKTKYVHTFTHTHTQFDLMKVHKCTVTPIITLNFISSNSNKYKNVNRWQVGRSCGCTTLFALIFSFLESTQQQQQQTVCTLWHFICEFSSPAENGAALNGFPNCTHAHCTICEQMQVKMLSKYLNLPHVGHAQPKNKKIKENKSN